MRDEYLLIRTLRMLKTGVAQNRPAAVPEIVWDVVKDCLSVDPNVRPTAKVMSEKFEKLYEGFLGC